jgi:hypothetical protein
MSMAILDDYEHRINDTSIPILGSLCWYAVQARCKVSHDEFARRLSAEGLDRHIPAKPRDDDTFLRVTSDIERKREPVPGHEDVFENFLVRKVVHSKGHVIKQIVVEKVDGENKRLDYRPVVELEFITAGGEFVITPMGWPTNPRALELAQTARDEYHAWRGSLPPNSVRTAINNVIVDAGATLVKPTGGIYFLLGHRLDQLRALERVLAGIEGAFVHGVPLIDETDQREMLRQAFIDESVGEMMRLTEEMNELAAGDKITGKRFTALNARMEAIKAKAAEYSGVLEVSSETTELRMQALEAARRRLFLHVRVD